MQRNQFVKTVRRSINLNDLPTINSLPIKNKLGNITNRATLIKQFVHEANAVKCHTHLVNDHEIAMDTILNLLSNQPNKKYMSWDDKWLPIPDFNTILKNLKYEHCNNYIPQDREKRQSTYKHLEQACIGITGCSAGLADTGSIILESQAGQGRLCSLLVPIHVALITSNQIYPTMESYLSNKSDNVTRSSNCNIITGPSRTSDITQTLTLGIHGPGTLHIVIIDN